MLIEELPENRACGKRRRPGDDTGEAGMPVDYA